MIGKSGASVWVRSMTRIAPEARACAKARGVFVGEEPRRRGSYPPAGGEGRREAPGWGSWFVARASTQHDYPHPARLRFACRATLPTRGRVKTARPRRVS